MKIFTLLAGFACLTLSFMPAAAQTTTPASTTTPDNSRYLKHPKLLADSEARLAAFNNKPCDILFIGASIIGRWPVVGKDSWDKFYAPRHTLDIGIDGDMTQNVLWRLDHMHLQNLKPKVVVIQVGSNSFMNTPQEIADGIKAVLAKTQTVFPGAKIILVCMLPDKRANEKMMQVDSIIKDYADNSTIYYLDLVPLMPPVTTTLPDGTIDTNWKGLRADHLHPTASGYQMWADAMEPILSKLLAGGTN